MRRRTAYLVRVNVVLDTDEADDESHDPSRVLQSLALLLMITLVMVGGIALGLALLL